MVESNLGLLGDRTCQRETPDLNIKSNEKDLRRSWAGRKKIFQPKGKG